MDRREFVAAGVGGVVTAGGHAKPSPTEPPRGTLQAVTRIQDARVAFPRLANETFVNAAAGTPLGSFAAAGLARYQAFQQMGPAEGRGTYVDEMVSGVRGLFGDMIGAKPNEIALVHCTKAGEQIAIDGFDPIGTGRNIVTNDLHFTGSLHNLEGLRRAGAEVRIVRSRDWDVPLDAMADAIDGNTALVAVTLLSNVTGRVEPMRRIADLAHARGAYVYADIIQAAGVVPLDMRELGIDFAAANGYKWLYGVHGAGFLYVREELQGTVIPDRQFPGHVQYNYQPWVTNPLPGRDDLVFSKREDATRYEPGHVSYLGYCSVYEGLRFVRGIGLPAVFEHSVRLNKMIDDRIDRARFRRLTPDVDASPILTYWYPNARALEPQLRAAGVVVTVADNWVRISPAVYNTENDVSRVVDTLNG